jgi:hypothetical protein
MSEKPKYLSLEESERALLDTGVLFAINKLLLHPMGMALFFSYDDNDQLLKLGLLQTHDGKPWSFDAETTALAHAKLEKLLTTTDLPNRALLEKLIVDGRRAGDDKP